MAHDRIDCKTKNNRAFNRMMRDNFGRPDLCVKESYTKEEIMKMREKCKRMLSSL